MMDNPQKTGHGTWRTLKVGAGLRLEDLEDTPEETSARNAVKERAGTSAGNKDDGASPSGKVTWQQKLMEEQPDPEEKPDYITEHQMEIENRIRNMVWTICGDYSAKVSPDLEKYRQAPDIALYDAVKQGAFHWFFDTGRIQMYLVKKIYLGASEPALMSLLQLCVEVAVHSRILQERPGTVMLTRRAYEAILSGDLYAMSQTLPGRLKIGWMQQELGRYHMADLKLHSHLEELRELEGCTYTEEFLARLDYFYNNWMDQSFLRRHINMADVERVTMEELREFDWQDYLSEEMQEQSLDDLMEQMAQEMVTMEEDNPAQKEDQKQARHRITVVTQEQQEKVYSYIERNFGRTYLTPLEEKKRNFQYCKGIHCDCSLYYTHGILADPVMRNYQYEYARKQREKNRYAYHEQYRLIRQNIRALTELFKKTLTLRDEVNYIHDDYGTIVPSRLWRVGRVEQPQLFLREQKELQKDFVVDILIDASGSQRSRQEQVVLQAYILMEALSNVGIPHRVTGFCTFWDYTILQQYRDYDDDAEANARILNFSTSSNNRDGLAIRAVAGELLSREEEKKILLILSDGRPYDCIANRPNARNPRPYFGAYALKDTASEIRSLRNLGVSVLGIFAGEKQDLEAEKKIFGRDFAYIRKLDNFSRVTGQYLKRQMEE